MDLICSHKWAKHMHICKDRRLLRERRQWEVFAGKGTKELSAVRIQECNRKKHLVKFSCCLKGSDSPTFWCNSFYFSINILNVYYVVIYRILLCNYKICYFTLRLLFLNFSSLLRSSDSSVEHITFDGQEKQTHEQKSPSIVAHLLQSSSSKAEASQQKTSYNNGLFFYSVGKVVFCSIWQGGSISGSLPKERRLWFEHAALCYSNGKKECLQLSQLGIDAVLEWKKQTSRIILVFKPSARKTHFLPKQISYQKKHPAYQPVTLFDSTCQR